MFFENGYGLSAIRFKVMGIYGSRTSNENEWEVAVLIGDEKEYHLCYNTPITNDVIGNLTKEEVSEIMRKVQELPS